MLLAIGPLDTKVGDEVCFVAGSMMPFVLRPPGEETLPSTGLRQARFVGEAYVNGAGEPVHMFTGDDWERLEIV